MSMLELLMHFKPIGIQCNPMQGLQKVEGRNENGMKRFKTCEFQNYNGLMFVIIILHKKWPGVKCKVMVCLVYILAMKGYFCFPDFYKIFFISYIQFLDLFTENKKSPTFYLCLAYLFVRQI
jgi:hypothetical protein